MIDRKTLKWINKKPFFSQVGKIGKAILFFERRFTYRYRCLPHFVIIGSAKCGTGSLYFYIAEHPNVIYAHTKEVHYFDRNYSKGIDWYRSNFPYLSKVAPDSPKPEKRIITGEATPAYMFVPDIPQKMAEINPGAKLIMILRNPVTRSYSHYQMSVRKKRRAISFEETIKQELEIFQKTAPDRSGLSIPPFDLNSILQRSIYYNQIERWLEYYPKEQMLFLKSEDFFNNTAEVMQTVFDYLELTPFTNKQFYVDNPGGYKPLKGDIYEQLTDFFRPYNQKLYDLIGQDFGWETEI